MFIFLSILVIIIFVLIIVLLFVCNTINNKMFSQRLERTSFTLQDFPLENFPLLKFKEFSINCKNNKLVGRLYSYEDCDSLIIFCHGYGAGHMAYIKEIDYLCQNGFSVFAFDYTGCDLSGGKPKTFAYSVKDLNCVYNYLKDNDYLKNKKVYLLGHSWGGYTCLSNKLKVDKIVAISPFYSPSNLMANFIPNKKFGKFLKPFIYVYLGLRFFPYGNVNANEKLKKSKIKTLIVKGDKDNVVPPQKDFNRDNLSYLICKGKAHNPYYTINSEENLQSVLIELNNSTDKQSYLKKVDYSKITEHDYLVLQNIIDFLKE